MKKLLFCCLTLISHMAFGQTIFETILPRINEDIQSGITTATLNANVASALTKLQTDGKFSDISNYTNAENGVHLSRVRDMARAYSRVGSAYKDSVRVYNAIVLALNTWYTLKPDHDNWWYDDINYPQSIGQILILMRYGLSPIGTTLENQLVSRMKIKTFKKGDGANTTDESLHYLYRACLTQNTVTLDSAATFSFEGISYSFTEGMNEDDSFTAHGKQLYINGYGGEFIKTAYNIATFLEGTSYALSSSKKLMLNKLYLNTFVKAGRGSHRDFNTGGRGISRGSGITHSRSSGVFSAYLGDVRTVNPTLTVVLDSVSAGTHQLKPVHNRYFRGDYDLHIRPGYTFGVRTVSNRTVRAEKGNGENLLGKFLSDGATNIQRIGPEYQNIYPIWEWDKIPGTTARDFSGDAGATITAADWGSVPGVTAFVGGVSDSLYSASAYDMDFNGVKAKKSWFFFDHEVVCLGTNITATATENLVTSINQCWLFGNIQTSNAGVTATIDSASNTSTALTAPNWVLHDKIGYFFPTGGNITINNKVQTGSWSRINNTQSTTSLSGTVFNMWINHGVAPGNAKYAYIVVPNINDVTAMQNYNSTNIKIVKNSDTVQAVRHLGLDMMQVIFYKAGTVTDGTISVTVNAPCALLFKQLSTANVLLSIADPSQQNGNINVTFSLPGIAGGTRYLSATLPTGDLAGASARYLLNQSLPLEPPSSLNSIADAYMRDGTYAGTNYGSATMLVVKKESGAGYSREAIFKFDPRSIQRPVSLAKLHLYVSYANSQAGSGQWAIYQTNSSWTESTINWNNKPAQKNLIATVQGQSTTGYVDFDITTLINSLHPDSLLSLKLVATTVNSLGDAGFGSKESAFVPQIIIDDTAPKVEQLGGVGDAYVKSGTANVNTNFGNAGYLAAQNGFYESYLQFDLNNIAGKVVGAKLKLNSLASAATQWQLYKVNNNSWTETGITWNNKPTGTDSLITTINAVAGTVYFDIVNLLKSIPGDGLLSFKIVATANVYSSFSSKQASNASLRPSIEYLVDTTGNNGLMMMAQTDMLALKSRLQNALTNMKTAEEQKLANDTAIFPANLVTPNGDGRNDTWLIRNIDNYKKNSVKVFSINGQLIYSRQNYDNSWNATYNGAPLMDGAYVYIIDKGDQTPLVKGVLNVISNFK